MIPRELPAFCCGALCVSVSPNVMLVHKIRDRKYSCRIDPIMHEEPYINCISLCYSCNALFLVDRGRYLLAGAHCS